MQQQILNIWTDLYQELKKFILSKVKDNDACNDILQDVFLKIHSNIHTLKECSKLTTWVYQITRNTVADYYRKRSPAAQIEDIDIAAEEFEEPLYQSLSNCINSKIKKLPQKYKQAILLTTFENYSQLKLAAELDISYSGAKTRVQRAREKLKDMIVGCPNVETDSNGNLTDFRVKNIRT